MVNLRKIHELYLLLKTALPPKEETYLIHEVTKIMESVSPENFEKAMKILYKDFNWNKNPGKIAEMFVEGLKKSGFFAYIHFINGRRHH